MILAIDQLGVSSKSYETALPAVSSKKGQPSMPGSILHRYTTMRFLATLKNAYFN
jgi:hypothetical protein